MEKTLVVYFKDNFVNIPCDRIVKDDVYIVAYKGEELVGLFPIMCIDICYISVRKA